MASGSQGSGGARSWVAVFALCLALSASLAAGQVPVEVPGQLEEPAPVDLPAELAAPAPEPEAAAPEVSEADEPLVRAIEVRADLPAADLERIRSPLQIKVGEPLTEQAMRRTLGSLFASGLASEIEIRTRPAGEGEVVAMIVAWATVQVEDVRLEGELGLPRRELQTVLPQRAGQPLIEDRVVRGVFRLQDLYRAEGYFEARAVVRVEYPASEQQAQVIYQVTSGPRARVGTVSFTGNPSPFGTAELTKAIDSRPGRHYRHDEVQNDVDRLRNWLLKRDYRTAQVDGPAEEYHRETGLIDLSFPVESGPKVTVTVSGAEFKKLTKKDLLPFMGRQGYDEALLFEATEKIREYYQEQGHYDAQIESREEEGEGEIRVILSVEPGPVYALTDMVFEGNSQVSSGKLLALMETSDSRLLGLRKGRLVDPVLRSDLDNVQAFYLLEGFLDAKVGAPRIERNGDELVVVVPIDEGRQRKVADLVLQGAGELTLAELEKLAQQRQLLYRGGPFHPLLLEESVDVVQGWYQDRGWSSARVAAELRWNEGETLAEVTLTIDPGPRTVANQVILRGNSKTEPQVILKALAVEPGQPLSRARLLDLQRRLFRLGVFSRVTVDLAPAEPGETERNVLVRVEEGRTQRVSYGLGYDTEDGPRGLLGYTNSNLGGRAYTLRADMRLSDRDRRFRLAFDQPNVGEKKLPLTYSLFYVREDQTPFRGVRWGGAIESSWHLSPSWRLGGVYEYRIVEPEDLTNSQAARENQQIRISSLTPSLLWDTRDDLVNPTRGGRGFYQVEYAFNALSTNEQFTKLFMQQTQLVDLGRSGTVVASLRLGAIEPRRTQFGDLIVPPDLGNSQVAISERFFAGGPTTHRAFKIDELGIEGRTLFNGQPVGGNGLLLLNLDYRFPIAGAIGGVVFLDAGQVWAEYTDLNLADLRTGAGLGVSYLSPIGPLHLGIGWKLDRKANEDSFRVFISLGNPF